MSKNTVKYKSRQIILLAVVLAIGLAGLCCFQYSAQQKAKQLSILIRGNSDLRLKSFQLMTALSNSAIAADKTNADNSDIQLSYNKAKKDALQKLEELRTLATENMVEEQTIDSIAKYSGLHFSYLEQKNNKTDETLLLPGLATMARNRVHKLVNTLNENAENRLLLKNKQASLAFDGSINALFSDTVITILILIWLMVVLYREINKREKVQEELFVSREWLSQTLYCMGDAVITTNEKGDVTFVNKAAEELSGIKVPEVMGKPIEQICELLQSENKQSVENPIRRALLENKIVSLPENVLMVNYDDNCAGKTYYNIRGKIYHHIEGGSAPIRNDNGKTIGAVMVSRDITDQAMVRRKLVENERLLKNIVNNINSTIYIKDLEGNLLLVNDYGKKLFNLMTKEEVKATNSVSLFSPESAKKMRELDMQAANGAHINMPVLEMIHADGSEHVYHATKFPLYDHNGIVYAICGVSTDMTETQRNIEVKEKLVMQNIILKNELKYTSLFLNAPIYICVVKGKEHVYEFANPLYMTLTSKKEIIGKRVADIFPEVIGQGFMNLLDNVYKTGESFLGKEVLVRLDQEGGGGARDVYLNLLYQPYINAKDEVEGIFTMGVDVTEQVLSRKKIEKSEKRFRSLIEHSVEMLSMIDGKGNIKYMSPAVERAFEISSDGEPGKNIFDFTYADDVQMVSALFNKVLENPGLPVPALYRQQKRDGAYIWVEGNITNMLHVPEVNAIVTNFKDITKRKVAEEKNFISERLLSEAQTLAKAGNWNFDVLKNEVYWSDGTRDIYGVDKNARPSFEAFASLIHPEDKERVLGRILGGHASGKQVADQYRIQRPDGEVRVIKTEVRSILDENGKMVRAYGTSLDITELTEAQELLQHSERNLRTIFDNTSVAYLMLDSSLNVVSFNKLAQKLSEEKLQKTLVYSEYAIDYFPNDIKWNLKSQVVMVICNNRRITYEKKFAGADGNDEWFLVKLMPVADKNNMVFSVIIAITDITERKLLEIEREKITKDLMRKNKDLNVFAYMVSHNLRSPIAKIMGLSDLVESDPENQAENADLIQHIAEEVHNLDTVVKEMNTVISARDAQNIATEAVAFERELKAARKVLENQVNESNAKITYDFKECTGITTVKSYLNSIIYNLLSNAIKYRSEERQLEVHIETRADDEFVSFSVSDNGSGIDLKKNGDKLFGLYKRFHNGSIPGRGVGLSLVKAQVEAIGGKIEVVSEVNKGTTFNVFIPKKQNI